MNPRDEIKRFGFYFCLALAFVYANALQAQVNVAPSFTKGANQSVLEDSNPKTVDNWAKNIKPGPASELGQEVDFIATNNRNSLFSEQPALSPSGTLTFTPAPQANGAATVTVRLHDGGGTEGGGKDTSAAQTFTITVLAINNAPSFELSAEGVTVLEDAPVQKLTISRSTSAEDPSTNLVRR